MRDALRTCTDNFGLAPRTFSLWDRLTYFRVPKPLWLRMNPSDGLMTLFRNLPTLFSDGIVVWGHIVQANLLMFEAGNSNCPGEVVYSLDARNGVDPEYLLEVAHKLYGLKGTEPTSPDLRSIADYLTDELIRVFGLAVPTSVSPSLRCKISTTFFVRKHLPNRRLCASIIPLVVNPKEPNVAMPLPDRFWPAELAEWWSQ